MPAAEAESLRGKVVVFTGKLACMTRVEAAKLVRSRGGMVTPSVNRRTSIVVVGQEGWPLQRNGRLTAKLLKTQRLQAGGQAIVIYPEEEFLRHLGLDSAQDVRRHYTASQLAKLLNISRDQLRSWLRHGLIRASQSIDSIDYFDYSQVIGIKTLSDLLRAGVKVEAIRRSLQQLRQWLPGADDPLAKLILLQQVGELGVRHEDGLVEPTGQRVFEFDEEAAPAPVSLDAAPRRDWFALACEHEEAGQLEEAAEAYRQGLRIDGADADSVFNLANVLYALDEKSAALERYYQVLELDGAFAPAWVNVGVILGDQQRPDEAAAAFRTALLLDPENGEARYNLADLLQSTGKGQEAAEHWREYLKRDPQSPWGRFAREQLRHG
jgi:tetratricopeptide (TPR) repeat protein